MLFWLEGYRLPGKRSSSALCAHCSFVISVCVQLMSEIGNGDIALVQDCIAKGADLNTPRSLDKDSTPLKAACGNYLTNLAFGVRERPDNWTDVVRVLLQG